MERFARKLSLVSLVLAACTDVHPPRSVPAAKPQASVEGEIGDGELGAGELGAAGDGVAPEPPPPPDLGGPEVEHPPLGGAPRELIETPLSGPAVLYGQALQGLRPHAPGRSGELLVVVDSPYQVFGRNASYLHVVAWQKDGRPAAGARVYVGRRGVGRTNASGSLVFAYQPEDSDGGQWGSSAVFAVDDAMRCGAVGFQPYGRTETFATDRLFVYTDRGIFQPGETIHTRVIGWRLKHDYAPLAGADVEMLLHDGAGHSIAAATGRTDEFGVTAVDLRVPLTAAMGDYQLRVAYGQERASTRLQIRRFDPPALRMEHTLGRFLPRNHHGPLVFDVTLHPPTSEVLGKVDLQVVATAPGGKLVFSSQRAVRGNGPHELMIAEEDARRLIDATQEGELAHITLHARDELGRDLELVRELRVTKAPYVGVLELDRDQYTTGDPVAIVARLSDRDSVPVRSTEVRLDVGDTPGEAFLATTDDAGMARFSFEMPARDTSVTLSLQGVQVSNAVLPWTTPKPMRTELASPIVLERQATEVIVRFPAEFEPVGRRVHMDMTDTSGAIVGSKLLRIVRDAHGHLARGQFRAPSWGSMLLSFFALGRSKEGSKELGLLVSGQNLVVQTDRELEIQLEGLPERAAPGGDLAVRAHVRTAQGKDAEVSLGVALVDKNVLALKDPLEITPMDRFYNPALRTLATTGSKILTWPVVSRNWGSGRRSDVALPPFEWLAGGDVESCRAFWDEEDWKAAGEQAPNLSGVGSGQGFGAGHGRLGGSHKTIVTIRTRFPTTALWEPHLRGVGTVDIRGQLPDRIGDQELIVVASDKQGGVGVARASVEVTQPVFVRADLPSSVVAGERIDVPVMVHNGTTQDAEFTVELEAGASSRSGLVSVRAGTSGAITLPLAVDRPGSMQLVARAVGAGHDDQVVREVVVVPHGTLRTTPQSATLSGGKTLELELSVPRHASGADGHLRVELPAITTAFARWPQLAAMVRDDPWGLANDLTSAALLLQLAGRLQVDEARVHEVRGRVFAALTLARRVQGTGGSFAYWRNGEPSAFITARVLEGMIEARAAGLDVPSASLAGAAEFVAGQLAQGDLASVREIAWWEGDTARVREGITAEMFDILSRVPAEQRSKQVEKALAALTVRYRKYLAGADLEPLAAGRALAALLRLEMLDAQEATRIVTLLLAARDEGHWEPSWFHAFGGRADATLAVLSALTLADPTGRQADKRDALAWILSTQNSWGAWHADAATTAALRALQLVGAGQEEIPCTITVRLDGKLIETVEVDPADPWQGTRALTHLDLGSLKPGKHNLTLDYTGQLTAAVRLVSRHYRAGAAPVERAAGMELRATGPAKVRAGSRFDLVVFAQGPRIAGGTVWIGRSGLLELDLGKLGTMIGRGRPIAEVVATNDSVALTMGPSAEAVHLALPWIAARRGSGRLPTIGFTPRKAGTHSDAAPTLFVDPGRIQVE